MVALMAISISSMGLLGVTLHYRAAQVGAKLLRNGLLPWSCSESKSSTDPPLSRVQLTPSTLSWFLGLTYPLALPLVRKMWITIYAFAAIPFVNVFLLIRTTSPFMSGLALIIERSPSLFPVPYPSRPHIRGDGGDGWRMSNWGATRIFARKGAVRSYGTMVHATVLVFLLMITREQTAALNPAMFSPVKRPSFSHFPGR